MMFFSGFLLVISTSSFVFSTSLQERQGGLPIVLKPRQPVEAFLGPPIQPRFPHWPHWPHRPHCSCGVRNVNGVSRIVGGTEAKNGEFPWRVAVFTGNSTYYYNSCGGTIISQNWVMTAAHCLDRMTSDLTITVFAGAHANPLFNDSGIKYSVDRHFIHPNYNPEIMDNDIALVHIQSPIIFANNVAPVCLPWDLVKKDLSGASVVASGWGTTQPVDVEEENTDLLAETLLEVSLPYLTTSQCQQYLPNITDNQVCTYNPGFDTCQGDSGGSIEYQGKNSRYYSVGVVSWGNGCAQTEYPGVYTKVTNYLQWIQSTTADTFCKE